MKKMLTPLNAIYLMAMFFAFSVSLRAADTEPNNSLATANALALNTNITGTLTPGTDSEDWYVINLPNVGSVTVTGNYNAGLNGYFYFFRPDGSQINYSNAGSGAKTLTVDCIGSSTIYLLCNTYSGAGGYNLQVTLNAPSVTGDVEPNNSIATIPQTFTEGQPFSGYLGHFNIAVGDANDYFKYVSPRDGNVTFSVTAAAGLSIYVYLYKKNGQQIGYSSPGSGLREFTANCQATDTIIGLIGLVSGCGSYMAVFNTSTLANTIDTEPNNTIPTIKQTFTNNQSFSGHLGYSTGSNIVDGDDYFYFLSPRDGNVTLSVTADPSLNIYVYLYRKNGQQLGYSSNGSGLRTFTANCQAKDTLVGRISYTAGCGSYTAVFNTSNLPNSIDIEPNNSIATIKQTLTENQAFSGHANYTNGTNSTDTDDYFYYVSPRNGDVTLSATADPALNIYVYLYRKNGQQLGYSSYGSGLRTFTAVCQAQDTIVGRISSLSGCGSYSAVFNTSTQAYANDLESNNSIAEATFTSITKFNQGQLGYTTGLNVSDNDDYYAIKVSEAPFQLTVPYIYSSTLQGYIYLYNAAGGQINFQYNPGDTLNFNQTINSTGIYYLRFSMTSGCGSYRFGVPCESGGDIDQDNICDGNDGCLANGGLIKVVSGNTNNCLGDNFEDNIQVSVTGKYGQGTFGLVTFPDLDIVALSSAGTFNMATYPAGIYRIGHIGTPSLSLLQGVTNVDQITGCFDLSNFISVNTTLLIPGTISANSTTTVCGNDGVPSIINFTSSGATGVSYRWAVLDQTASTVLANNTTGSFDFDVFGPGSYRVTRAVYSGLNPSTVDPQNLPACIRRSNLITVNVTSCSGIAALVSQPNPSVGLSTVSFTLPESGYTTLEVYDMSGRNIQTLYNEVANADQEYRMDFNAESLPNGVYIYRLTSSAGVTTEKFILAR